MKSCAFFGHRNMIMEQYREKLLHIIIDLIENKDVTQFYSGFRGDFDLYCSSLIYELKDRYPHIKNTMVRLIQYLPEEILSKVKDKRLLAIGYADQKVKNAIQSYTKIKINDAYKILERSLKSSLKASVGLTIKNQFEKHSYIYSIEELFDETYITNVCKKGNDLYIELDGENTIVLSEVETLEEEIDPQNTEISLFELYKVKQDYELHFLLKVIDDNLAESFHYVTYKFIDIYLFFS